VSKAIHGMSVCDRCAHKRKESPNFPFVCIDCFTESNDPARPVRFIPKGTVITTDEEAIGHVESQAHV